MDYRVKKVGDDWNFLPKEERKRKSDYEKLWNKINRKEKWIQKTENELKKIKKELRELKKDRTKQYNLLVKYHKKFIPNFSISLSKNKKPSHYENSTSSEYSGNLSWTIYVTVQGKRKSIYLGTIKNVSEKLDLIEGVSKYYKLNPHSDEKHQDIISDKIEKLVCPLIREDMLKILNKDGNLDSFLDDKVQGKLYLDRLYKNSEFYEEPKPKKPKPKGKRMNPFIPFPHNR